MEAITIGEVSNAAPYRRNQMIVLMNAFGVCEVDKQYHNDGDGVLDAAEAVSLIKLAEFDLNSCNAFYWRALIWMAVHGAVFRLIAWLALHFGNRQKKV